MTMLARFMESPMAERLARAHLHFLWQGLAVGVVAWLLLAAMRRASASARYLALVILMNVLAACPLATYALIRSEPDRRAGLNGSEVSGRPIGQAEPRRSPGHRPGLHAARVERGIVKASAREPLLRSAHARRRVSPPGRTPRLREPRIAQASRRARGLGSIARLVGRTPSAG